MRICLARSIIEDSGITPDSFVNEARQLLANRQGVDLVSVYIIYKGKVLRKNDRLKDYGRF